MNPACSWGRGIPGESEIQDDAGGEAAIVLGVAEEAGLQVVALEAPGDERNEFVVEASAESGTQRSVTGRVSGGADVDVSGAEQGVGEGADFADGKRNARTEQIVVLVGVDVEGGRAAGEIVRAVETA